MTFSEINPETLLAQALDDHQSHADGIVPALHLSTTFIRDDDNEYRSGLVYARPHNPTTQHVERILARLEQGQEAFLFGSGMAAATTVFLALKPGDHVIAPVVMYWFLRKWLAGRASQWGLDVSFVAMEDIDAVKAAIRPGITRLIWVETPANPLWGLTDIRRVADLAHAAGAKLAVDSTVATPVLTQALTLGADIVMHSATKYLNGHSDVLAGALVTKDADDFWQAIRQIRTDLGAVLSPRDAAQLLRGMRTLHLRVRESCRSAMTIALHYSRHPAIAEVLYPGLKTHPGHELASQQMIGGYGGMLSIRVKGGAVAAIRVAAKLQLWKRATSLGGVESLVEHRASMEGPGTPVPDDLLRLSVGIENCHDLIADLDRALAV